MILLTKIFTYFLSLLVIFKTAHDYKKRQENLTMSLFWIAIWIGISYVATFPDIFYKFAIGLSNESIGSGTLVGLALVSMLYLTYRVYTKANRLEQKIKNIVMKIGIKDLKE